ncbi:MAG TPA: hypothetical protein VHV08_01670, partial [Pirellulales bacterium]|nr:hypothetical protein [Pirellulales bacterium]
MKNAADRGETRILPPVRGFMFAMVIAENSVAPATVKPIAPAWLAASLVLLVGVVYVPTLGNGFIW